MYKKRLAASALWQVGVVLVFLLLTASSGFAQGERRFLVTGLTLAVGAVVGAFLFAVDVGSIRLPAAPALVWPLALAAAVHLALRLRRLEPRLTRG
jgi:hypothetical protein